VAKAEPGEPITETAGEHVIAAVPTAGADDLVAGVIATLSSHDYAVCDAVWVLDDEERLTGIVPLPVLLGAARAATLRTLMRPPPPAVTADVDQERVAALAHAERLTTVPVVDNTGSFLGVVPALAIIDVLRREHDEDMRRIVGIFGNAVDAKAALEMAPWRRTMNRLPWLVVGLVGSMLAALVMAGFEQALQAKVAIAFFIPAIVYLADAIGTQTEAVAVRGLSLEHAPLSRLLQGEVATGAMLGLILGGLAFPVILIAFDFALALAVAIAVFAAGTAATAIGLVFPWLLSRAGGDPAYGSGPVATIIQDVLSLLVYFATVSLLV
jgi:magnesium transporter